MDGDMVFPWTGGLVSTNYTSPFTSTSKEPDQDNPRFGKIAQGVRYSKTLILFYHASIVCIILVLAITHWTRKVFALSARRTDLQRWQARRAAALQHDPLEYDQRALITPSPEEVASSSSSTLTASTASSDAKSQISTEMTPLLRRHEASKRPGGAMLLKLRSLAMYQPPPIPLVNKQLPDSGTSVVVLFLVGVNLFFLFFRCPLDVASVFILADRAALLFAANLPYLYLLSAKNQPLQLLAGRSYEGLNIFHRRLGEWLCSLALLHSGGMIAVWYTLLRPAGWSFGYFLSRRIILVGLIALIYYELLYLTSLASVRQRLYEFFLATHITLQASALALLWFHHPRGQVYVAIALAIFLVDRLLFRILSKTRTFRAELEVLDITEAWVRVRALVPFDGALRNALSLRNRWTPAQHVYISVPELSGTHALQAHPFTIGSQAPSGPETQELSLDLIIRAHDGFTRDILRHATTHATGIIRLDGPYGSTHAVDMLSERQTAVVVAAGTGLAVAIPLLGALVARSGADADIERLSRPKRRRIILVWVVRSRTVRDQLLEDYLTPLETKGVELVVPPPTAEGRRPNIAQLLFDTLNTSDDVQNQNSIGVVSSAPNTMNRSVRNFCAQQAWQGWNIDVITEKFDW